MNQRTWKGIETKDMHTGGAVLKPHQSGNQFMWDKEKHTGGQRTETSVSGFCNM